MPLSCEVKHRKNQQFYAWVEVILFIRGLNIYKFVYLLKFIFKSKISISGTFMVICRHTQGRGKFKLPDAHVHPAEITQNDILPPHSLEMLRGWKETVVGRQCKKLQLSG